MKNKDKRRGKKKRKFLTPKVVAAVEAIDAKLNMIQIKDTLKQVRCKTTQTKTK